MLQPPAPRAVGPTEPRTTRIALYHAGFRHNPFTMIRDHSIDDDRLKD